MSILKKAARYFSRALTLTETEGWQQPVTSSSGVRVEPSTALGLSATWACVNLIAGTTASLPFMVYRWDDKKGFKDVARDHWLFPILHDSPNYDQTAVDFWEFVAASIELHGDGIARKLRGSSGQVVGLYPVRPDIVSKKRLSSGDIEYSWSQDGESYTLTQEDVLHIRGPFGGPLGGASALSVCRDAFGSAISTNLASAKMFERGATPSGVLSTEHPLKKDQRDTLEELLQQKFAGAQNAGRPMLLDNGLSWQQLTIKPQDAQMLESRRFSVEEICRIFGVPPHMVGHTENSTSWGTGIEQQAIGFKNYTLRRRLKRIEQAVSKQLLSPSERAAGYSVSFNIEGLLRGDSKSRAEFHASALQNGWATINEVRAAETKPPVEGGDVPRMQSQNIPITETPALEASNGD